jgi:Domain of unknown function (DUF4160)
MPTVCVLPRNIRIEQRYKEHNPPHFHATQGGERVSVTIAELSVLQGAMNAPAFHDVVVWAKDHQRDLALNWVLSLALMQVENIPWP